MKTRSLRLIIISVSVLAFVAAGSSVFSRDSDILRIPEEARIPSHSPLKAGTKAACFFQYDDGTALTYFPNWNPGDMVAIYFDPQECAVPYPFPFQITDVEFLLFNHAGVESTQVSFSLWSIGSDACEGPQTEVWSSSVYTVTTFSPDWTAVSFTDDICADEPFFFVLEYVSGEGGAIPGIASDTQQEMVDTCYQWLWHSPASPPWWEWNRFWNDPDPGWIMLRLAGETYSMVCDTGWTWLGDNGYAPSGTPDVDAGQDEWVARCGPVAAGNCLEWFGANLPLGWAVPEFVDTLASYFQTDSSGTEVHNMRTGIDDLLNDFAITGLYTSIWPAPDFDEMVDSLSANQNIILLLGFWWWDGKNWWREGGHFVTLSGVKPQALKIAVSDPAKDAAEYDWPGRVRPPDHPDPPHDDTLHNDLQYVSHDIYQSSSESPSPGNPFWQLTNYLESDGDFARQFTGMNCPSEFDSFYQHAPAGTTFVTEVEYAVMICTQQEHMFWESGFPDYAPSGMPDFDQRQDNWINSGTGRFTFSAPTAVASSFWWIDSKFNLPLGTMGDGVDQFPLVRDYLANLSPYSYWDDHDLWNVDHTGTPCCLAGPLPATPQPFVPGPQTPGSMDSWGELVERLAWRMDTDGMESGGPQVGTKVQDIGTAVEEWLASETFADGSDLSDSLCAKIYPRPTFPEVQFLVQEQENVILLLGFWYLVGNKWWRVGGHYVTVAGINPVESTVAFSDPFFDHAETGGSGRVLSGSYIPHTPTPHGDPTIHNDPGNVSHDIYQADGSFSHLAGEWQIPDYAVYEDLDYYMDVFDQQDVPEEFAAQTQAYVPGYDISTVVEYAVLVDVLDYRGDVNGSGSPDVGDIVFLTNYLYRGGDPPWPPSLGDLNCDGVVNVGDLVFLINFLFRDGDVSRCCGP